MAIRKVNTENLDFIRPCPLCGGEMSMYSTNIENGFSDSLFLRCESSSCLFGDTKKISWEKSLIMGFNNRYVSMGTCIAKDCYEDVVVRASHLCDHCEGKYL